MKNIFMSAIAFTSCRFVLFLSVLLDSIFKDKTWMLNGLQELNLVYCCDCSIILSKSSFALSQLEIG